MPRYDYDLFTIGAGSGGVRAARLAGALGKRSGLAEEWTVGGTCVHRGCIPKKFYVYASHFAEDFEDAAAFGWRLGKPTFDWPALVAAKTKELERLEGIYEANLKKAGVDLMRGRAVLEDPHTVSIDGKRVTAENILIATGGRPYKPDIPGAELMITSDEVFDLDALPKKVLVAGAGYIALEFAAILNGLGADTTVVYRGRGVLRGFDPDIRETVEEELRAHGIDFIFETVFDAVEKRRGRLAVTTSHGEQITCDQVLMAAGRRPNTHGIGLVEAGVELGHYGTVVVDHYSRSTVPHIFAIGDCTDRVNLTPVAIHEAVCLIETLFKDNPLRPDHMCIPTAVFTQPAVGTVGMTEDEARAEFGAADIYRAKFRPLKHTITGRETRVMLKIVVERDSGRVLGVHMVGAEAPELVQALAIAVKAGLTKADFDATMAVHPTTAEELVLMYEPTG